MLDSCTHRQNKTVNIHSDSYNSDKVRLSRRRINPVANRSNILAVLIYSEPLSSNSPVAVLTHKRFTARTRDRYLRGGSTANRRRKKSIYIYSTYFERFLDQTERTNDSAVEKRIRLRLFAGDTELSSTPMAQALERAAETRIVNRGDYPIRGGPVGAQVWSQSKRHFPSVHGASINKLLISFKDFYGVRYRPGQQPGRRVHGGENIVGTAA